MRVAEPAADGHGVLWVEDVARRRVVDDDRLPQITSHLAEILDVVALMVVAAFSKQPVVNDVVNVELVQQRVAIFRDRCCEDHDLVQLANALQERIHTRPFDDINVVRLPFDLDWYREIGLMENLVFVSTSN